MWAVLLCLSVCKWGVPYVSATVRLCAVQGSMPLQNAPHQLSDPVHKHRQILCTINSIMMIIKPLSNIALQNEA